MASLKRKQMIGKVFGSWKVLELDSEHPRFKDHILYYKCECLECNKIFSVKGALMRNGGSNRCSKCGCKHSHAPQIGQIRTKRTPKETALYYLYNHLRKDARKREQDWKLTREQVSQLVSGDCHYCGQEPNSICAPLKHHGLSQKNTEAAVFLRNGIDRVDSSKGYTMENVVSCCARCNVAKGNMSAEEFRAWVKRVLVHLGIA